MADSTLYYFYSVGCGFCKKAEPIVDELISDGYEILKLDLAEKENQELNNELKKKYDVKCGTPWFINGETGHEICGFREKDILMKWVNGEEIPKPPQPKSPPPRPPQSFDNKEDVDKWKDEYSKWKDENSHMPNLPTPDQMLQRVKQQQEMMKQRQLQQGAGGGNVEARINIIEQKLDRLMKHLGVSTPPTPPNRPPTTPPKQEKRLEKK